MDPVAPGGLPRDAREVPTGEVQDLAGTDLDFRAGQVIGTARLDTAFTGLERGADGIARASVEDPLTGRGVELWADDRFRYLMCFTADTVETERRRRSIAIEPMTCPPDAFRSGKDLVVLEPGETWEASWGLHPH